MSRFTARLARRRSKDGESRESWTRRPESSRAMTPVVRAEIDALLR